MNAPTTPETAMSTTATTTTTTYTTMSVCHLELIFLSFPVKENETISSSKQYEPNFLCWKSEHKEHKVSVSECVCERERGRK